MKRLEILTYILLFASTCSASVITYPAPKTEVLSKDYRVSVGGRPVDVYVARVSDPPFGKWYDDHGGPYSFVNFDLKGSTKVRITAKFSLRNTVIRPVEDGVSFRMENDHTLILSLPGPCKLSIEPNGKNGPLLLFANPLEENVPKPDSPGVIYFGPGTHKPGKIVVTNNQTLYLAGGAVVKGGVLAQGNNIRIAGRGILDSSDYEWRKGPTPRVVAIQGTNIDISGITIRGASHWAIVPLNSRHVTIRGVKLCGSRVQNDDGINPCNSQDVLITNCFIRTDDDCIAMKGVNSSSPDNNVERITVENCILWCDRARIFLLGHESHANFMRNITLRNLEIIHFAKAPFLFEPGEEMTLENVRVENVRIHGEGQNELIRLMPTVNRYMRNKVPGYIRDVCFSNITVSGQPGMYHVQVSGADEKHTVQDVTFDHVEILGEKISATSEQLEEGPYTQRIRFQ